MTVEAKVAQHYTHGSLEDAIIAALKAAGKNPDTLQPDDFAGIDEFHLGWRAATTELAKTLTLTPQSQLLDIGSGIGGPARYFASALGCEVTGIDLTQEFVDVANSLTRRCGLAGRASFRQASALAMPFKDASFDAATLIHVGMNIKDKATLFAEAHRVLRKGGRFVVYDVMRMADTALSFPMPWAQSIETSFVETPEAYRTKLREAGFTVGAETNRREFCLKLAQEMREKAQREGPPPLGPQVLMGATAKERLGNVFAALEAGTIAPVQIETIA
jgi:ubiquinone/menaquinone biosynthesis C-methylase UbiE